MSDTSQGPGWWLASDGKWYPPELRHLRPLAATSATQHCRRTANATTRSGISSATVANVTHSSFREETTPQTASVLDWAWSCRVGPPRVFRLLPKRSLNQPAAIPGGSTTWGKAHSAALQRRCLQQRPDAQNGQGGYCADNDPVLKASYYFSAGQQ